MRETALLNLSSRYDLCFRSELVFFIPRHDCAAQPCRRRSTDIIRICHDPILFGVLLHLDLQEAVNNQAQNTNAFCNS